MEFDLIILVVMLASGFLGGVGYRAWQARQRSAFTPLRPLPPPSPRLPASRRPPSTAARASGPPIHAFVPLAPQARREPGAPCFVCGLPLDEEDHTNCG